MDGTTGADIDGISKKDFFCTDTINVDLCQVSCGGCESCDDPTRTDPYCEENVVYDSFCTAIIKEGRCPVSCGGCQAPSAEEDTAIPVTADVTSAAAGHADFTFELIGGGVASVALLALLVFASR